MLIVHKTVGFFFDKFMKDKEIDKIVETIKTKIGKSILEEQKTSRKRFFVSDPHFQDERLNLYGRDLRFKNAKEVDEFIVTKWNETVGEKDLVIVCGDVSMTREGLDTLLRCNGEKWIVKGNYDTPKEDGGTAKYEINDKILSKYFTKVVDELEIEVGGETVYINHYPTNAKADMFNIVGHIHGLWKCQRNMVNVGLDAWHFTPVSEDLIKFQMNGIRKFYDKNVFAGELKANTEHIKGEVIILRAPENYNTVTIKEQEEIVVFLAGCIQGSDSEKMWQEELIKKIENKLEGVKTNRNIVLASPRRLGEFTKKDFDYNEQVNWESEFLNKAGQQGVVVFWLAKEEEKIEGRTYCQTSRFELGEWFSKGKNIENFKIVIGADKDFHGTRYVEKKFKDEYEEFELYSSLNDVADEIVKQIKKKI